MRYFCSVGVKEAPGFGLQTPTTRTMELELALRDSQTLAEINVIETKPIRAASTLSSAFSSSFQQSNHPMLGFVRIQDYTSPQRLGLPRSEVI